MGGNGVSNISARAGEGVGGVVNGAGLTSGSIARSGASGGGRSGFDAVVVNRCPFMRSERERRVSPM